MSKKITYFLVTAGLLLLATPVLAVQIPNFLNVSDFCGLLTNIFQGVLGIIGSLGTLMILVSGILYLTSAGNPEKVGTAKKALFYAIAGLAVGLAGTAIVATIKSIIGAAGGSC
jgi:hypothetical protein